MNILWYNLGSYLSLYLPTLQYFVDEQRACEYHQIRIIATRDINIVFVVVPNAVGTRGTNDGTKKIHGRGSCKLGDG